MIISKTIPNNRTNFNGIIYAPYGRSELPCGRAFDTKILTRLKNLTADRVEKASLHESVLPNLTLKDGTNIYFHPDMMQVLNKSLYKETVFPDGQKSYSVPFSLLKQDADETGSILPNLVEDWQLIADADNIHEFIDASARLMMLFKQFWK